MKKNITQCLYLKGRLEHDKICDWFLNIDTIAHQYGTSRISHYGDSVINESLPYSILKNFLRHVDLSSEDVLFDVGCGTGRILCWFARKDIKKVVGIEIMEKIGMTAERNLSKLRGLRARYKYEIQINDACGADYSDGTIYVFFNPFGRDTLADVLDRIRATLKTNPRKIQIVYIGHTLNLENEDIIISQPWLKMSGRYTYAIAPRWRAIFFIHTGT